MASKTQIDLPQKQYLDIDELSTLSGLSVSTLRRYVRQGKIIALQPGGPGSRLLFRPDALERAGTLPEDTGEPVSPGPRQLPGRRPGWMTPRTESLTSKQ
ncbi:MAG: helix-turn-helix domain-containing protein [Planctomycetia bacterium]|nr:helix-turn-helix domain-containing protein [Planctomycetia bacterium]